MMGVPEKVALIVTVIVFYQIKIRSCSYHSRAYTQDDFTNYFKKIQRSNSFNNFSSSKIYPTELTKGQIPKFYPKDKMSSICDIFQFPEVEYPLSSFRCPAFYYNYRPINKMGTCDSHCSSDIMKSYTNIDMNGITSKSKCLQDRNKWNLNKLSYKDNNCSEEFQKQHFILQNNVAKNHLFDEVSLGICGDILNQLNKKRSSRESMSKSEAEISENHQDALINPSSPVEIENVVVGSTPLSFDILSSHGTNEVSTGPSNKKETDQSIESLTRKSSKPIINLIGNLLSTLNEILNLDENNLSKIDYENTTLSLPKVRSNTVLNASNEKLLNQTGISQKTLPPFDNYNETNTYQNNVSKLNDTQESQTFSRNKLESSLHLELSEYPENSTLFSAMNYNNATINYPIYSNVNNTTIKARNLIKNETQYNSTDSSTGGVLNYDILLFSDDLGNDNMENSSLTNLISSDDIDENIIPLDSKYVEYTVSTNSSLVNVSVPHNDYSENNQYIDQNSSYPNKTSTDLQITNNIEDTGQEDEDDKITQPHDSDNRTDFNIDNINAIVNKSHINSEVNTSDTEDVTSGFNNFTESFYGNYNNAANTTQFYINETDTEKSIQFDDANVTSVISNFTQLNDDMIWFSDKLTDSQTIFEDNEITPMSSDIQSTTLKNLLEPTLSNVTAKSPYKIENHVNVNIISLALDQIKSIF